MLSVKTTTYLLRDVPSNLWTLFNERCAKNGWSMRWVLVRLIRMFAHGELDIKTED
jgi:hypothetical protein